MRRACLGVLGLVLIGGAAFALWWSASFDSHRIEQTLATRLAETSGFDVSFGGAMQFEWLPVPGLTARDITVSNPRDPNASPLAHLRKIRIRLDVLRSLRSRTLTLGRLTAVGVQLSLTRNAQGDANWQTGAATETGDARETDDGLASRVRALEIQDMEIHYRDAVTGRAFEFSSVSFDADRSESGRPVWLNAKGNLNDEPFSLTGTLSRELGRGQAGGQGGQEGAALRLDVQANLGAGAATLNVSGRMGSLADFSGTDLQVSTVIQHPAALARQLGETDWLKWAEALGSMAFQGQLVSDGAAGLSLRKGKLELGTDESFRFSLSGSIQDVLGGSGFEMDLDLKSASVSRALSSLDLDWAPLGDLRGQAQLRGSAAAPRLEELKLAVGLGSESALEVRGRVVGKADAQAEAGWSKPTGLEFKVELRPGHLADDWGPLVASGRAKGSASGWVLDPLDLELGKAHFTGRGAWVQKDRVPVFELSLQTAQLDLRGPFRQTKQGESEPVSSPPEADEKAFSFGWLSSSQAHIQVNADRVLLGPAWTARDLEFSLRWSDGRLQGPDLKLDWPEGGIEIRGRLEASATVPSLVFGLAAEGIQLEAVAGWLGQPPVITGQAQWTLDLKSRGASRKALVSNLAGGTLVYVQHGTVLNRFADALELGILSESDSGEQPMNCLVAALVVNRGVIRSEALLWEAPSKQLRGVGALDLANDHLDLLLRPHLKRALPTSLTAAIRIEGSLYDLKKRPQPLQTAADLTRGLLGRALRAVRVVSPDLSDVMEGVGTAPARLMKSTGLDVPIWADILENPVTCESVLSSPKVAALRNFNPEGIQAN